MFLDELRPDCELCGDAAVGVSEEERGDGDATEVEDVTRLAPIGQHGQPEAMQGGRKKETAMATVNTVNVVALCSKTQKRKFASLQEAERFEARNRSHYSTAKQHAYACDECDSYHLSSLLPGANGHSTITTDYAAIENGKTASGRKQRRRVTEDDAKQMRELRTQGLPPAEIAVRLDFSLATVNKQLTNYVKQQPVSLDAVTLKKKELEEQLRKLQEEEQRIIEAKRLKVNKQPDGHFAIRKESQFIVLSPDDCADLCGKLEEVLTATEKVVRP